MTRRFLNARSRVWKLGLSLMLVGTAGHLGSFCRAQDPPDPADPTAGSPLLQEPQKTEDIFAAATLMVRIGRPALAKGYLEKFLAANPGDDEILAIRDQYGPALFLGLANNRELQPASTTLLDRVNTAFRKAAADPTRVDSLIDDLTKSPRERVPATTALRSAGTAVIPQMIRRLAAEPNSDSRDAIVVALTRMGNQAEPPLIGALQSPDENVRVAAIEVLGYLESKTAAPYLWLPAAGDNQPVVVATSARVALTRIRPKSVDDSGKVNTSAAVVELKQLAAMHLAGKYDWKVTINDNAGTNKETVEVWIWSGDTVKPVAMPPAAASMFAGAILARDALQIQPNDKEAAALYLALILGAQTHQDGISNPPNLTGGSPYVTALQSGRDINLQALQQALTHRNAWAATGLLRTNAQLARPADLQPFGTMPSPLVAALDFPDRRVQFAAADTIMQLEPRKPFPQSQRIVDVFVRSLSDDGAPGALVVDPNVQRANELAALLGQAGFGGNGLTAATGQGGFLAAAARNDIELVAVNANVARWPLSQTVANFRADARTAKLPVVIFGPAYLRSRVEHLVQRYPAVAFIEDPTTLQFLELQLKPFVNTIQTPPLTGEERARFAETAAFWLARIADTGRTNLFDISTAETALSSAIDVPELADNALRALVAIPTRNVQQRLQTLVVTQTTPLPLRQAAAQELGVHIQRYNLLLNAPEIQAVRTLTSQPQPPEFSAALATVLGSLEPNSREVGEQLRQLPPPLPVKP